MRTAVLSAVALLLAILALPAAGANHYDDYGTYCPGYDVEVEGGTIGLQASSLDRRPWGAVVLRVGEIYIIEDVAVVNSVGEPWMFSLAFYQESGVLPGLQRNDEVCVSCDHYDLCDFNLFY